ncbi:hypothetical protein VTJ49DRAFT_6530 [Mycothermus thermophilus]|uniref:Uncharacterized protein n=1 Tax=Humicola insolens TaxID=85995 RepID=A0ABR3VIX7_HUMIN
MSEESARMQSDVATDGSVSPRTTTLQPREPSRENITPVTSRTEDRQGQTVTTTKSSPTPRSSRWESDEWDASKVPPSRFQKRKGSIYAVPSSRDGRVDTSYADKFHEKLEQMGYGGRRKSVSKQ